VPDTAAIAHCPESRTIIHEPRVILLKTSHPPTRRRWSRIEGRPYPLGMTYFPDEQRYNFALYSKNATAVILHLFSADDTGTPVWSYRLDYRINKSGRTWHCRLPAEIAEKGTYYGYTV